MTDVPATRRAVGQAAPQTWAMVRGEAVIVALFGTVGGLGVGPFPSWALASFTGCRRASSPPSPYRRRRWR